MKLYSAHHFCTEKYSLTLHPDFVAVVKESPDIRSHSIKAVREYFNLPYHISALVVDAMLGLKLPEFAKATMTGDDPVLLSLTIDQHEELT